MRKGFEERISVVEQLGVFYLWIPDEFCGNINLSLFNY